MSIIPVGNRKDQVNQGPLQNQSILDSVLFKKFGQGAAGLIDNPAQKQKPGMQSGPSEVDDAMMQGGLNAPGQADQHEQQFDPRNQAPQSPQGVQPAGQPAASPASQFLGQGEVDEQSPFNPLQLKAEERRKIHQFTGGEFDTKLNGPNPDGTFDLTLVPPPGVPIARGMEMVETLLQQIGATEVPEESYPGKANTSGVVTVKYRPSGAGPQKISKGK